jgi:hypothetical protein
MVVDPVEEPPRQQRHGEDLLNAALEPEQGDGPAAQRVHGADAHVRSSGASRSVIGMPLKTADSRTSDSPTKANSPRS